MWESFAVQRLTSGAVVLLARGGNSRSRTAKRRHKAGDGGTPRLQKARCAGISVIKWPSSWLPDEGA